MSKVAGRSSVTNSPSLVRFVCARAGTTTQVESPITAARRVMLMGIAILQSPPSEAPTAAVQKSLFKVNLHSSSLAGKRPGRRGFPASREGAQCTTACFCARSFPRNNKCNAWRDRVSARALTRALQAGVVSGESSADASRRRA